MIEVNRFTLDNGIRVVHNYDSATAMVALNVLVNAGARNESPERTGLAHLCEHMMFGGSRHIPDFDRAIEDAGGYNNAFTSNDFTNYYSVAPACNAETLFWLESDRFLEPLFTEETLNVQRSVVIEEFKQTSLNRPYGDMSHLLRSLVYRHHPYRWPVIGMTPEHVASASRNDLVEFFNRYYTPQRMIISVCGNITADRCFQLAQKWFSDIPSRHQVIPAIPSEPQQTHKREQTVHRDVPLPAIVLAFPMAAYGQPGYREADIITDILSAGRSSRFYRKLMLGTELFTEIDASILGSEDAGYLMLSSKLREDTDSCIDQAIQLMTDEAMALSSEGNISQHELERVRNRYESDFTFSSIDFLSRAQTLAMAEHHGKDINLTVAEYRAITSEQIASTARDILRPERMSALIYRTQQ